jgi:hypothetical protein
MHREYPRSRTSAGETRLALQMKIVQALDQIRIIDHEIADLDARLKTSL